MRLQSVHWGLNAVDLLDLLEPDTIKNKTIALIEEKLLKWTKWIILNLDQTLHMDSPPSCTAPMHSHPNTSSSPLFNTKVWFSQKFEIGSSVFSGVCIGYRVLSIEKSDMIFSEIFLFSLAWTISESIKYILQIQVSCVYPSVLQKIISNLKRLYSKKHEIDSKKFFAVVKIFHYLHLEVFNDQISWDIIKL